MEKIASPIPPIATATNPGVVSPADQTFPPAPHEVGTPSTAPLTQSNGEVQWARTRTETAPPSAQGLTANVEVSSQSFVKNSPPVVAERLPTAVNVAAGTARAGGLPKNVMIR